MNKISLSQSSHTQIFCSSKGCLYSFIIFDSSFIGVPPIMLVNNNCPCYIRTNFSIYMGISNNCLIISEVRRKVCLLSMTTATHTAAQAIRTWTLSVSRMKQRPFSIGNSRRILASLGELVYILMYG